MTFNQASSKGYIIKKGSKGVPIEYWICMTIKTENQLPAQKQKELLKKIL